MSAHLISPVFAVADTALPSRRGNASATARRRSLALLLAALFGCSTSLGLTAPVEAQANPAGAPGLDGKEAFSTGFPQGFVFRGEMQRPLHRNYDTWQAVFEGQAGMIRKFVTEELPKIVPDSVVWADRYARAHPEKLLLLHLNGEGRQVTTEASVHARYFPGHWVYHPGSALAADLSADGTEMRVADAGPFKVDAYLDRGDNESGKRWFPQMLALVALDERGNRDWNRCEFVVVTAVDKARRTVTVKRGQLFSKALPHAAGRTYAAPLAAGVWGGAPMAFYNLATTCPRDRAGRNAADAFVEEIAGWFAATGPLARFDGIAFDVNYWKPRDASWDVDNDNRPDGGIVGGNNVWREGDWAFLRALRRALGEGKLITADGQHAANQQAVGVLDGIESEGLVQHNDGFRGFSRAVNTHLYWAENNTRPRDFRYVVLKLKNPADEKRGDQLRRFAVGAASCLGARTTAIPEGVLPAAFAAPGALGLPAGQLLRPARATPDLLRGVDLLTHLVGEDCSLRRDERAGSIAIESARGSDLTFTLKGLAVPAGDLTLFLDAQALEPLEGFAPEDAVPRMIEARVSETPRYGEGRYDAYYTELYGYCGTHRRSLIAFYLRRPGEPARTLDVSFRIEGRGRVALYGITAHAAADALVRVFDKGVVAVNPALEPREISLAGVPGAGSSLPATVRVPALDAVFLPRGENPQKEPAMRR